MNSRVSMPSRSSAPDGLESGEPLIVASVPAGHVYVRHLAPLEVRGPHRMADPAPAVPAAPQQWWPPVMLDPAWVTSHDFDVLHLHFGFDARTPEQLEAWVAALRDTGRPLVYTVHDLRNPHHESRQLHDEQLDVLVPAADELISLTVGAADEIRTRWGRETVVLPHPHVVPLATMAQIARRPRRPGGPFVVGVHVKSLRAAMDPLGVIETLMETVADLPGAVLRVDGHRDVLEPGGDRFAPELSQVLHRGAGAGRLELSIHDYFTDDELWCYLASLDVSVLPYRFGTHSGWLEACRDLGTTVVAPTCGYFADQGPVLSYVKDEARFDPESLARAIREAHALRPCWGATVEERLRQRRGIAIGHDLVYRAVLRP